MDRVIENIYKNAIRFLVFTVDEILSSSNEAQQTTNDKLIKTSIFLQTTVELALKFSVSFHSGLRSILDSQRNMNDEQLIKEYENNNLKVSAFETLKNLVKTNKNYMFEKHDEIKRMEKFQTIRNRVLHSDYFFSESEFLEIEGEFIYIIIHIIIPLLYEPYNKESIFYVSPVDFLKVQLGQERFNLLTNQDHYIKSIEVLAEKYSKNNDDKVIRCVFCNQYTWLAGSQLCLLCNINETLYDLLDCPTCMNKKTVIYDYLNIEINENLLPAKCQYCGDKLFAKKCEECGNTVAYSEYLFPDEMVCECSLRNKIDIFPSIFGFIAGSFVTSENLKKRKIIIKNDRKNVIQIAGDLIEEEYKKRIGEVDRFEKAVYRSIDELVNQKLIELDIEKEDFFEECKKFINCHYSHGTEAEVRYAFKLLSLSEHGYDSSEKINLIFKKVMNNNYDSSILSMDDKQVLYKMQDNFSLDWKLFYGLYDDLTKPLQVLVKYRNEGLIKTKN
ncbi:hypothetical protein [Paenibacillus sp. 22594]|uniref:hypothetical protein n=1 Tax=Paenibacillus sp. 22594 TaxID=3453947 RepID=UPI003F86F787